MKNFNTTTANNDEWLTPPEIIASLGAFDLDPCAPITRPWDTATTHYTKLDEGLSKPWQGRVWLNPPYGRDVFLWLAKLHRHKSGLALIFARTETAGFHKHIWSTANAIFFFKGRLRFHHVDGSRGGTANAPSCLVSYGAGDTEYIIHAAKTGRINGKLLQIGSMPC